MFILKITMFAFCDLVEKSLAKFEFSRAKRKTEKTK